MSAVPVKDETASPTPFAIVASGHAANGGSPLLACKDSPLQLLKPFDEMEFKIYSALADAYKEDPVHACIPSFHGVSHSGDSKFISMGNLLHSFSNPKVMDVKVGTRTFVESEACNQKLRPDLFQRMVAEYPADVTDDERKVEGVLKYRWMDVHDRNSTTRSLGYRIGGAAGYCKRNKNNADNEFNKIYTQRHACAAFHGLVDEAAPVDKLDVEAFRIALSFRDQLCHLRSILETSEFFANHECIGTSLLLVADASGKTGVFWIDFAKTQPLEKGMSVTHRDAWKLGNREDGVLSGIDNMISAWNSVVVQMLDNDEITKQTNQTSQASCLLHSLHEVSARTDDLMLRAESKCGWKCTRDRLSALVSSFVGMAAVEC